MTNIILTKKLLQQLGACESGIQFCQNNKLFGFNLQNLNQVSGTHEFLTWIKQYIKFEFDQNKNLIYLENSNGYWKKQEFDQNNNLTYWEDSDGYWKKQEFDQNKNLIYLENSNGYWKKQEFDQNNNLIYLENSNGYWKKQEFDQNNNLIYWEDSDGIWKKFEFQYYGNGQLKSIIDLKSGKIILKIPFIEK